MPGVPKSTRLLPPGWSGDYSLFNIPSLGEFLFFLVFMTFMVILALSIRLALKGDFLMSAVLASILALSILAILVFAWFKVRTRHKPPENGL